MRHLLIISLIGVFSLPALADDHDHHHEEDGLNQVRHYAVDEPETDEQALVMLDEHTQKIEELMVGDALDDSVLEAVHEASYSLEAAVDKLRENVSDEQEATLDTVDEAVQALHYASEKHEEEKTRKWFAALQPAVKELHNVY